MAKTYSAYNFHLNAKKLDMFQLGMTLFIVIFETMPFAQAIPSDFHYNLIMSNEIKRFSEAHPVMRELL
jgi:hypothetical protein